MTRILLLLLFLPALAHAQWYALGSVGRAHYASIPNKIDNARFCDNGFTCSADDDGSALQLGAGYRVGAWAGLNWSIEGAYARTGTMKLHSQFPKDEDYDIVQGRCLQNCDPEHLMNFRGDWHMNGGTLSVLGAYPMGAWSAYGKLGLVVMHADGSAAIGPPGHPEPTLDVSNPEPESARVQGWRVGGVYGLGVSYDAWRVKPFAEINQTFTSGQGYPGFSSWVSVQVGVRVDL